MQTRTPAIPLPANALIGILLIMAAVFVFAAMDVTTKHLAALYPVPLIVALRYFGNIVLLVLLRLPVEGRAMLKVNRYWLVGLRALCLSAVSLFAGLAMQAMPVAETTAIVYIAPLGVMLLAGPLLGERVSLATWIAAAVGFLGVILICRPGNGLAPMGVIYALLTAVVSVGYHLLSRVLARTETTQAMLFYTALCGTVIFGAMLPWNLHGPLPGLLDTVLFASIGGMALLGHYCFTAAYRYAPASLLSPVNYMQLFWALCLGWLVFDHLPDSLTLIGGTLVAASGAGLALWTSLRKA